MNDLDFFLQEMADVKPIEVDTTEEVIKKSVTISQLAKKEAAQADLERDKNVLTTEYVTPIDPYDVIFFKKDGVQDGVFKKLRLGRYPIESSLNLTQCNLEQARQELFNFVNQSFKYNIRLLHIVHGLGLKNKPYPAAIKSYTNNWLRQFKEVIAFHSAIKQHGGYGSTYVLLKKSEEKKRENKERHRKY